MNKILITIFLSLFFCISVNAQSSTLLINEFLASNDSVNFDEFDEYDDWIEIYNSGNEPINLSGKFLTDDFEELKKWEIPSTDSTKTTVLPDSTILIWLDDDEVQGILHSNFKLNSDGEFLALVDSNGESIIDSISFQIQRPNISFGRKLNELSKWLFFEEPTPNAPNITNGKNGFSNLPIFTIEEGRFFPNIQVSFENANSEIYFTTDSSDPIVGVSNLYSNPIFLDTTTVIRAITVENEKFPSKIISKTYLIEESFNLPTISLVTNPPNLWDWNTGIYVKGPNAAPNIPHFGANFWMDWEKHSSLSYFEEDGSKVFSTDLGIKIYGGWSRVFPKKSFSINFDKKYDLDKLEINIFEDKPHIDEFGSLVLRADARGGVRIRNELMYQIHKQMKSQLGMQTYKPTVLYLNGEYWGIYNLMEKKGNAFIERNYGYKNIDMLSNVGNDSLEILYGSETEYLNLLDFMNQNDITQDSIYEQLKERINFNEYIDFWIYEIYSSKGDTYANIRYWRPQEEGGKWHWIGFDYDWWLGLNENTLERMLNEEQGNAIGMWTIGRMMKNPKFRNDFINRFCDYLNTTMKPENAVQIVQEVKNVIIEEMPKDLEKWNLDFEEWNNEVDKIIEFVSFRPDSIRSFIKSRFNLEGETEINLNVGSGEGKIKISTLSLETFPWNGKYLQGIPVTIEAIPEIGYKFTGWENEDLEKNFTLNPDSANFAFTANFEREYDLPIVINEINFQSGQELNSGDWIELINISEEKINLKDWSFTDSQNNSFKIHKDFEIKPNSCVVLCQDSLKFEKAFPQSKNFIGNFTFGLNKLNETVKIIDSNSRLIDSLTYSILPPWQFIENNSEFTIQLEDPTLNNTKFENWKISNFKGGTPEFVNFNPPTNINLLTPENEKEINSNYVYFSWNTEWEIESNDKLFYNFHLWGNGLDTTLTDLDFEYLENQNEIKLENQKEYFWQIETIFLNDTLKSEINKFTLLYKKQEPIIIENFEIFQNYPNPFNPSTKIKIAIPQKSKVSLKIFNILGQEVKNLLNENLDFGFHEIIWYGTNNEGKNVSSGIYFYKIETSNFREVKKMLLIR